MEGRRVRLPVFLARCPEEPGDSDLHGFYQSLLEALRRGHFLEGTWRLCERSGWPDNRSYLNLVSRCWQSGKSARIIAVNLSEVPSQGLVHVPLEGLRGRK